MAVKNLWLGKYNERQVDAVIKAHDLEFMKNYVKADELYLKSLINTFTGASVLANMAIQDFIEAVKQSIKNDRK